MGDIGCEVQLMDSSHLSGDIRQVRLRGSIISIASLYPFRESPILEHRAGVKYNIERHLLAAIVL